MSLVSEQVKLVLERMDTHPEEFTGNTSNGMYHKWDFLFSTGTFNRIEKFLLKRKMKELRRKITQQQILLTIMYGQEDVGPVMSTASRFMNKHAEQHDNNSRF